LATITGSTTSGDNRSASTAAATAWMMAALDSIPVLTTLQPMSLTQTSICRTTNSDGTSTTP
jgi:hypothetical protein